MNCADVLQTLPTCVTDENPITYPPMNAGEYILQRLNATREAPVPLRGQMLLV
jgi:hypothetical protein